MLLGILHAYVYVCVAVCVCVCVCGCVWLSWLTACSTASGHAGLALCWCGLARNAYELHASWAPVTLSSPQCACSSGCWGGGWVVQASVPHHINTWCDVLLLPCREWVVQSVTSPLGVTAIYSAAFGLLLLFTATKLDDDDDGVPMAKVALFSSRGHAQYIYGLAGLFAVRAMGATPAVAGVALSTRHCGWVWTQVGLWFGALMVWTEYVVEDCKLTRRVLIAAAVEEAAILACGLLVWVSPIVAAAVFLAKLCSCA